MSMRKGWPVHVGFADPNCATGLVEPVLRALIICVLGFALVACQARSKAPGAARRDTPAPSATDPCATRLHDIEGAVLLYYTLHQRLPESLDQLRPLADLDAPLEFTCPVSNQPYVYQRANLTTPGPDQRLLVYDPTPAHQGRRWAILAAPIRAGRSLTMWVTLLDDGAWRTLLSAPAPSGVTPLSEPGPAR